MSVARRQDVEKALPLGVMKVRQIQVIKAKGSRSAGAPSSKTRRARLALVTRVTNNTAQASCKILELRLSFETLCR